jgi:hypothetical protein
MTWFETDGYGGSTIGPGGWHRIGIYDMLYKIFMGVDGLDMGKWVGILGL